MAPLLSLRLNMVKSNACSFCFIKGFPSSYRLLSLLSFLIFLNFGIPNIRAGGAIGDQVSGGFMSYGAQDASCMHSPRSLLSVTDPVITVRFSNPQFSCTTHLYIVDVEFQSDQANQELSAMNVKFWYDDNILELVDFRGYMGGYGALAPNPPTKSLFPAFGPAWFNFAGPAEYISGGIQKVNSGAQPIIISITNWTKLFQIAFIIDDPNADYSNLAPAVVLDLEVNPANGSFLTGEGVSMIVTPASGGSGFVTEHVAQFNWQYIGGGSAPFGQPISNTPMSVVCPPVIACPANVTIACGASSLPTNTGSATATDYCPGNPTVNYTDALNGGPCPQPYVITRSWHANDNCGSTSTCQQTINVSGTIVNAVVTSLSDSGTGTLRDAIANANPNDTIVFSTTLAGLTININSTRLLLNKNLYIRSYLNPRLKIASSIAGLIDIPSGVAVEFKDLDITSGLQMTNNDGAAFNNLGSLKLVGVNIFRNPNLPAGQYLIRNKPSSLLTLAGSSVIHYP